MAYALADRGARLLIERDGIDFANVEWSRKNRDAGRPFIEHQLEIMDFYVALATRRARSADDVRLIHPDELVAAFPDQSFSARNPFALRVKVSHHGVAHEIGVVPDLVFGLLFADGSRRCFMVEIDRGTMPIARRDIRQTSLERKMRAYLAAHAAQTARAAVRLEDISCSDRHHRRAPCTLDFGGTTPSACHSIARDRRCSSSLRAQNFAAPIRSRMSGRTATAATREADLTAVARHLTKDKSTRILSVVSAKP